MIRPTAMTHLFILKGIAVAPFDQSNMNNDTLVLPKEQGRASAKSSSSAFVKFRISCKLLQGC
jgi:cobyric acid synthase